MAGEVHRTRYVDVTEIKMPPEVSSLPERLLLGAYPDDALSYLAFIFENRVRVSVQLQVPMPPRCPDYHATAIGEVVRAELPAGGTALLRLVSVDSLDVGGGTEAWRRVYAVSSSSSSSSGGGGGSCAPWTWTALSVRWPDFGVLPAAPFLALMREWGRLVDEAATSAGGGERITAHVHCMAGRGRTGTFALARVLSQTPPPAGAAAWSAAAASRVLAQMRASRPGLVETDAQLAGAVDAAKALRGARRV